MYGEKGGSTEQETERRSEAEKVRRSEGEKGWKKRRKVYIYLNM